MVYLSEFKLLQAVVTMRWRLVALARCLRGQVLFRSVPRVFCSRDVMGLRRWRTVLFIPSAMRFLISGIKWVLFWRPPIA